MDPISSASSASSPDRTADSWRQPRSRRGGNRCHVAGCGVATWQLLLPVAVVALCATWQGSEGKPFSNTLRKAVIDVGNTGAVCLDGSSPAYYYRKGRGPGRKAWHLHFEGGGWCVNALDCLFRSQSDSGSSLKYAKTDSYRGIFNSKPEINPDFYNWNIAYIKYCDGGSFTGNMDKALLIQGKYIYFRGARIVAAVLADLAEKGLKNATRVLVGGDSAGGQAALYHCDRIRQSMPANALVHCYSDAGMFTDMLDLSGNSTVANQFQQIYTTHNSSGAMPLSCIQKTAPIFRYKCFFPQNFLSAITSPFFIINSNYDSYTLRNFFAPARSDPSGKVLRSCLDNFSWGCTAPQIALIHRTRDAMLKALTPFKSQPNKGIFTFSCFIHRTVHQDNLWLRLKVMNQTLSQAFGDFVFNRTSLTRWLPDCPYPCNTCQWKWGGGGKKKLT